MPSYRNNRPIFPTLHTIRIRKTQGGAWLQTRFLSLRAGSLCVDDGSGPFWIPFEADYIHPDDWTQILKKEPKNNDEGRV